MARRGGGAIAPGLAAATAAALLVALAVASLPAGAQGAGALWQRGDIAISGTNTTNALSFIQVFSYTGSALVLKDSIDITAECDFAQDTSGAFSSDGSQLLWACPLKKKLIVIRATGTQHQVVGSIPTTVVEPTAVAFDRNGDFYVAFFRNTIEKRAASGALLRTYTNLQEASPGARYIALDRTGQLLYYTSAASSRIFALNVTSGASAPVFNVGDICNQLQVRPSDGALVVACSDVKIINSTSGAGLGSFSIAGDSFIGLGLLVDGSGIAATTFNDLTAVGDFSTFQTTTSSTGLVPFGVAVLGANPPNTDVMLIKRTPTSPVAVGTTFSYVITVNVPSNTSNNVVVTVSLPPGLEFVPGTAPPKCRFNAGLPLKNLTCALGDVPAPGLNLTVTVRATATGPITYMATVSSTNDLDETNNMASATTTVVCLSGACCDSNTLGFKPDNTACAFSAPSSTNQCRDRGTGGEVRTCGDGKNSNAQPCGGLCQAGSCVLVRTPGAKCCKLPATTTTAAKSSYAARHHHSSSTSKCFCWRR